MLKKHKSLVKLPTPITANPISPEALYYTSIHYEDFQLIIKLMLHWYFKLLVCRIKEIPLPVKNSMDTLLLIDINFVHYGSVNINISECFCIKFVISFGCGYTWFYNVTTVNEFSFGF